MVRVCVRVLVGAVRDAVLKAGARRRAGGVSGRAVRAAARDEVPMLRRLAARMLRCQLELDEHHVITHAQSQGQRRAARQEIADLRTGREGGGIKKCLSNSSTLYFW